MTKPSQEYTIHILDDAEFDKLPFGKPSDSLGMSNSKTKTAWVRRTNVKGLDINTINHEFDELMAKTSLHEEEGIRYKKAGNIFKIIFTTLASIVNPALGAAVGGAAALHSNAQANSAAKKLQSEQAAAFKPSQATSAFSPTQTSSPSPLSDLDFGTGLSNIDANRSNQRQSVFSQFRSLGTPQQNTAFSSALGNVDASSAASRAAFVRDQEERKRLAGLSFGTPQQSTLANAAVSPTASRQSFITDPQEKKRLAGLA